MNPATLKSQLSTRFEGVLIGGAIGDALGFPFEGSSRAFMMALATGVGDGYEAHREGFFAPGQFSDDTQLGLVTAEWLIESAGDELCGDALAGRMSDLWRENLVIGRDEVTTTAMQRYLSGEAWQDCAQEVALADCGALKRAAVIGLYFHDDVDSLLEAVEISSQITHQDSRSIAAAAGFAAAIAYCVTHHDLVLSEFIDFVGCVVLEFDGELAALIDRLTEPLTAPEISALRWIENLQADTGRGGAPVFSELLFSFYYFLKSPMEFEKAVPRSLALGGAVDTLGSVTGALCGAMAGRAGLPANLLAGLVEENAISKLSQRLYDSSSALSR